MNRRLARDNDDVELTPKQRKELERRIADIEDPIRYLLVSRLLPRMCLYYDVSNDTFGMNDPQLGTLFKRKRAAKLVASTLGSNIQLIEVKVIKGKIVGAPQSKQARRRKTGGT